MSYRLEAEEVLAAWREVERDIAAVEPGSPEDVALHREAIELHAEYERLIEAARLNLRPEPPRWPGAHRQN